MKPLFRDAHGPLLRAISRLANFSSDFQADHDRQIPVMIVETIASDNWASATFVGQRHRFELRFEGRRCELEALVNNLVHRVPDAEIEVPGHLVADFQIVKVRWDGNDIATAVAVTCEALTIED